MTTILYVEDHPPAQLLMQAIISDLTSHDLVVASTGKIALEQTRAQPFDLYIVDLDLPDIDGIALAQQLCGLRAAPVIIVSAYAENIQPAPTYYYLAKPLDPEYLAETIQRALAGHG